jgi:hypothetical protein
LFITTTRGLQRSNERRRPRLLEAVVRRQVQIDRADPVDRAHQIELGVPREIAQVDRSKAAIREHEPRGLAVIRIRIGALIFLCDARAGRILTPAALQIRPDELVARCDSRDVQAGHLHLVAWLHHGALSGAQ